MFFFFAVPPLINTQYANISLIRGNKLYIQCNATGISTPNITLYKRNTHNDTFLSSTGTYTILSVNVLHEGLYLCISENGAGKAIAYIEVTVYSKYCIYIMMI